MSLTLLLQQEEIPPPKLLRTQAVSSQSWMAVIPLARPSRRLSPKNGLMLERQTREVAQRQALTRPTVDGQNPAPLRMMIIPLFIGFSPSQVVQDFVHQQYMLLQTLGHFEYQTWVKDTMIYPDNAHITLTT